MLLIGVVFTFGLIVIFAIVALMTRPTAQQNAADRRLTEILGSNSAFDKTASRTSSGLLVAEQKDTGKFALVVLKTRIGRYLEKLILQSQVQISVPRILQATAALVICVGTAVWFLTAMLFVAIVAALLAGYIPIAYLRFQKEKRLTAFSQALPDCIETCARSLRAGHSVVASLDIVAGQAQEPAKTEFAEVFKKQNYGLPLRDALLQMLDRVPSADLHVMVTAFLVQRDTGGNLVDILDRLVSVIRDRLRIQREVRIQTAQGRMTGWILCLLPVFLLIVINFLNPGYSTILFHEPAGRKMLYVGIALLLCGGWIIRHIINGIEV
ncbi:type II secretion system F family protein [Acidicapsa ligni]|uniref:type II secretion system F family protein n=1 Tax=Acidicapsa ligni TaxID=542300 RepID=UPI0021DFC2E2|nr:type II secretion system F family protein [Acidicapsa ligni]